VSATLIGFGVALVVFLLQAASSQSLSSQATYRAVLAHTRIVWPTTLALVFLVATAYIPAHYYVKLPRRDKARIRRVISGDGTHTAVSATASSGRLHGLGAGSLR